MARPQRPEPATPVEVPPRRPPMSWLWTVGFAAVVGLYGYGLTARAQEAKKPADEAPAAAQNPPPADEADVPAPAKEPAAPEATKPAAKSFLVYAIESSGLIGLILLLMSVYMFALVVRLFMDFRVNEAVPPPLVEQLEAAIRGKKFQEAYDVCKDGESYLAKLVRTGVANLTIGRPEAKEAMGETSEEMIVTMESKISYLATLGALGPLLGLLGTVWGMIMAFQSISTAGAQPRPDQLAGNIATALFTTLEGIILAVPAIFFFAFFRNRIAVIAMEATRVAERTISQLWLAARSPSKAAAATVVNPVGGTPAAPV